MHHGWIWRIILFHHILSDESHHYSRSRGHKVTHRCHYFEETCWWSVQFLSLFWQKKLTFTGKSLSFCGPSSFQDVNKPSVYKVVSFLYSYSSCKFLWNQIMLVRLLMNLITYISCFACKDTWNFDWIHEKQVCGMLLTPNQLRAVFSFKASSVSWQERLEFGSLLQRCGSWSHLLYSNQSCASLYSVSFLRYYLDGRQLGICTPPTFPTSIWTKMSFSTVIKSLAL